MHITCERGSSQPPMNPNMLSRSRCAAYADFVHKEATEPVRATANVFAERLAQAAHQAEPGPRQAPRMHERLHFMQVSNQKSQRPTASPSNASRLHARSSISRICLARPTCSDALFSPTSSPAGRWMYPRGPHPGQSGGSSASSPRRAAATTRAWVRSVEQRLPPHLSQFMSGHVWVSSLEKATQESRRGRESSPCTWARPEGSGPPRQGCSDLEGVGCKARPARCRWIRQAVPVQGPESRAEHPVKRAIHLQSMHASLSSLSGRWSEGSRWSWGGGGAWAGMEEGDTIVCLHAEQRLMWRLVHPTSAWGSSRGPQATRVATSAVHAGLEKRVPGKSFGNVWLPSLRPMFLHGEHRMAMVLGREAGEAMRQHVADQQQPLADYGHPMRRRLTWIEHYCWMQPRRSRSCQ